MPDNANVLLGQIIHKYRKANKMTLEDLSALIGRSKSTIGKYEQGQVAVEISVLLSLAEAFHVHPQQFFSELEWADAAGASAASASAGSTSAGSTSAGGAPAGSTSAGSFAPGGCRRFFYTYDGVSRRIMRGLMTIADTGSSPSPASLFYDIPSFDEPERCRVLYTGIQLRYEVITKYMMNNRSGIESPQLLFTRPLDYKGKESGVFFGISSRAQVPVSLKCIISDFPLEETPELTGQLVISEEDLKITRKFNQFSIDPIF